MRIFGSDRMGGMLTKLGLKEGEAIVHPWINKALEKAQQKVEARNFDIRKNLLKFDNVMNDQRKVIYEQRADSITYSANVMGQNNDKAVPFTLTTANTNSLVFENPAHDYPQKIVYQKNKSNGLVVTISGILQGKKSEEKYSFTKK